MTRDSISDSIKSRISFYSVWSLKKSVAQGLQII